MKQINLWFCCVIILFTVDVSSVYARKPVLRFSTSVDLPSAGIRLCIMPDATEMPPQPPTVYTYEIRLKNDESRPFVRVDTYSALELWRRNQHAACWIDKYSNSLVVATMTWLLPAEIKDRHILVSDFEKITNNPVRIIGWETTKLVQWVADFTGVKKVETIEVKRRPFQFSELIGFKLGDIPNYLAYAFRLRPNAFCRSSTDTCFFLLIVANPEIESAQISETIERDLLGSINWTRTSVKGLPDSSVTFQKKDVIPFTGVQTPDMEAMRNTVKESIKNLKDWWYIETSHYIVLSNLGTRYRTAIREFQDEIEMLRVVWERTIPPVAEHRAGVVRIFADEKEYATYVGDKYEWTSGLWIVNRQELVIRPVDWGGTRQQRERMLRVIYHEAFHQYLFHAFDRIDVSPWYNEGHAVFFENTVIDGKRFSIVEDAEKASRLEKLARENAVDVQTLLRMKLPEFYLGDDESRLVKYSLAWGLIYYLRKGTQIENSSPYAGILAKYREALLETRDPQKATEKAFADVDLHNFQLDITKFWLSTRLRTRALRAAFYQEAVQTIGQR